MKHNMFIGSGSGKLGNTVEYVRGGKQMSRVYQPIVANPNTPRQQLSRAKMRRCSVISRGLTRVLNFSLGAYADSRVSPRNIFSKMSIPVSAGVFTGVDVAHLDVDWEHVQLTKGILGDTPISFGECDFTAPKRVVYDIQSIAQDWNVNHTPEGDERQVVLAVVVYNTSKDMAYMDFQVLYNKTTHQWDTSLTEVKIDVPGTWQGDYVECYAFCKQIPDALNGFPMDTLPYRIPGECTKTVYCGTGTIA